MDFSFFHYALLGTYTGRRGGFSVIREMHELVNKSAVQLDNPDKFLSRLSPLPLRKGQQSAGSYLC